MSPFNRPAGDDPSAVTPRPLASWYTQGVSDGLGDRLLMFDNTDEPSLELLRFRSELVAANGFEHALRARVRELRGLTDPAFTQVRAIETLDGSGLALVSTFAPGKRLGEVLKHAQSGMAPAVAARIIRDLTRALAELHRRGEGVAHGCLTVDRIAIAPDGQLMIVEHVLGAALARVGLSPGRSQLDLGLVAPNHDLEPRMRIDSRTDVIQLGWIALSMLLGRRLSSAEYPTRADALVDEFGRRTDTRAPHLVAELRSWMERALQIKGDGFASAVDAHAAMSEHRLGGAQPRLFASASFDAPRLALVEPFPKPPGLPAHAATTREMDVARVPREQPANSPAVAVTDPGVPLSDRSPLDGVLALQADTARPPRLAWGIAAVLAVIATGEGVALARLMSSLPATVSTPLAPITLESPTSGDAVIVNGRQIGITPLTLTLTSEVRSLRIQSIAPPAVVNTAVAVPPAPKTTTETATIALAETRQRRGGLQIMSPIEVQVLDGERVLGSSADGPIVAATGRHEWDFVNSALGYRSRQTVDIKQGRIQNLKLSPPDGRVSINAAPWAQVSINGDPVGETPLANLSLAVGQHQITFRHPQLGEKTERVIVKSGVETRVSVSFGR